MAYVGDLEIDTAALVEPVSTAEAKTQARIDISDDDAYVDTLIASARAYVENKTGRQLISQTWLLYLDCFPRVIKVPKAPLQSVTQIDYIDTDGNSQTLSSSVYTVNAKRDPGEIVQAYGESWPATRTVPNAVTVTFVAGYGDAATDVPEDLIHAMQMLIAHRYDDRTGDLEVPAARWMQAVHDIIHMYDIRGYR